jgi:hypothetical protein
MQGLSFRTLAEFLEERLGSHQFPINHEASSPRDLFDGCALHDELSKQLLRDIYKRNACKRLDDPVQQNQTEAALAEIRTGLLATPAGMDVDKYNYVEDVCIAVQEFFQPREAHAATPNPRAPETASAEVIDINRYRRRRMKWRA